jgi:hypothetical protein
MAFDHETGKQVATDSISITLDGKPRSIEINGVEEAVKLALCS